ncbi:hypothetical protein G3570_05255 [Balneolaceae bacterium YR4-1]|uniref:LysM domain-containing protein n=1 Tax=Halalkalibaculum roseum TaxID=2709311 RepID=A0A6M1SV71_9BACT|nr:HU family DNA-binding protein [Halalkalibaculum roseum]NGP76026.1 hypothetical protein [Halalkalibaculum roseum]
MNHKITFQELVEAIAEQSGKSKQFTHDFIKDFASLIKEGLEENGSANVAGLGTFKLKKMDEREGYNPETEEKITIPAHNKVDFTPYKDLSELVNAPYAHMEPEILEEEVQSFQAQEEIEEETREEPEESESETGAAESDESSEKKKAPWEEDIESEIEVDENDPFGLDARHPKGPVVPPGNEEAGDEGQEESSEEEDVVAFSKENAPGSESEEPESSDETEGQDEVPPDTSGAGSKKVTAKPRFRDRSHRRKGNGGTFWVIAAAFIILLLAIGAWYLLGTQQQATPQSAVSETSQVQNESQSQDQQQAQTQAPQQEQKENNEEGAESGQQQAADEQEDRPESAADASQANGTGRQATGQDNQATDVDPDATPPIETVTVAAGQTLWGLADNAYENPYLWPWIYDTNQPEIEDPDLIYAGQLLNIPQRRGQNDQLSENDSLQVALGYVETYLWYKENNLENARFYLYAAKKYHKRVFEYTDATFDEDDLQFANRAQ